MKVAVLVLGYRYPLGLKALSHYFAADPSFDLFIHVDQKVDIQPFIDCAGPSAIMLKDRIKIFWCGWTMIEATMHLIKIARSKSAYDRYVLISDDSIPLVSIQTLSRTIQESADYIQLMPTPSRSWRYEKFFMFDSAPTQLRFIAERSFEDDAIKRLERMIKLRSKGKKPIQNYYQGSQWWSLSEKSIDKVITSWHEDPWLRESFEFSYAPDEAYFQQILGSSATYKSNPLIWVDWHVETPPKVFTSPDDLLSISKENQLFVRKIDFTESQLLKWVEEL